MNKNSPNDKPIRSKLLAILTDLDRSFLLKFQKKLLKEGSPKRDIVLVFNYCLKYHPNYDQPALNQQYAYQKIFKGPFDYVRLMRGISNIFLRLKQFLSEQELVENPFLKSYLLAQAYNRHHLSSSFQQLVSKKTNSSINTSSIETSLEQLLWNHLAYFSGTDTKTVTKHSVLSTSNSALNIYFVAIKLRYLCEFANRKNLLKEEYSDKFEESILCFCEQENKNLPPLCQLYWLAYQLIIQKEEVVFKEFKQLYLEKWCTLSKEDQVILLTYLLNYAAGEIRRNNTIYVELIFQLYQFGIDKEIFLINERFIADHFVNIIYISSSLNEFDWIDGLLNKWEQQISVWLAPSIFNLSMARLTFAEGLFIKCKTHLLKVDRNNYIYAFRAKMLEIACAYELKDPIFSIQAQCKAFENYLRRYKDKHGDNVVGGLNFISMMRQLLKVQPCKKHLLLLFNDYELILFPKWLLEKIEEV